MRRLPLLVGLLLVGASAAFAQDPEPPAPSPEPEVPELSPEQRRARGIARARDAQVAWKDGKHEQAAKLWSEAADLLVDDPSLRYNAGVAHEQAGDAKAASEAYVEALTGADTDVEDRALFNVSALALDEAWQNLQIAKADPAELARLLASAQGPDGKPLPAEQVAEAAKSIRMKAAADGLQAAKRSLPHLRDLVRRRPTDRDALHNLELVQRVRRELEELQKEDQSNSGEDPKQSDQDDEEGGKDEENPEQDPSEGQDGKEPQKDEPEKGDQKDGDGQDEKRDADDEQQQQSEGKELSKEQAERMLDQMLERAARRAREVREAREKGVRRAPVEKDW